jgi:CRP-like cAMP-binding protein
MEAPKNKEGTNKIDLRVETLKRSWVFSDLPAEKIIELAAASTFHRFAKGEFVFHEGDYPSVLHIMGSGMVKQLKTSSTGRTFTTVINSSGDPLSVSGFFGGKSHFVTTQAIADTTTVAISRKNFMTYVSEYPSIMVRILQAMGMIINSAYERLSDLAGETAAQRVLNALFMLYYKFGEVISFTREEIADFAGTTAETTTRVLSDLKSAKIIRSRRGGIDVLDVDKLRDLCHGTYLIPLKDLEYE